MSSPARLILCPQCHHSFPPPAGTVTACPRCGKVVVIPQQEAPPAPPPAIPVEHQATLPVICRLCSTRYYAKPREMGHNLKCPDCHTDNLVVPMAPAPKATVLESHDDIPLQPISVPQRMAPQPAALPTVSAAPYTNQLPVPKTPVAQPTPAPQNPQPPVAKAEPHHDDGFNLSAPVELPKYRSLSAEGSHLEAMLDQKPSPASKPPTITTQQPPSSTGRPVSLASEAAAKVVPAISSTPQRRPWNEVMRESPAAPAKATQPIHEDMMEPGKKSAKEQAPGLAPGESQLAWLERHPFTLGIIPIFRQTQVFARWMSVTILMAAQLAMLWVVLTHLYATGDNDADIGAEHILGMLMLLAMLFSVVPTIMAVSSFSLTIFEDTANGNDHISSWPEFNLMEWALGSMYFLGALVVSGLPGVLIGLFLYGYSSTSLANSLLVGVPILYLSWYVFFPIIFISMQETGTVLEPFSPTILPSFLPLRFHWLAFYFTSFVLSFSTLMLFAPLLYFGYTTDNFFLSLPMLIPCAFLMTAFPLIYFRFLGKIAQIYRDYMATVVDENDAVDEEETDMRTLALRHAAAHKRS